MPKSKITAAEVTHAIHVLNQLERHIDSQTNTAVTSTGDWFLYDGRKQLIVKDSLERMQAIRTVIRDLMLWQGDMKAIANRWTETHYQQTTTA